MRRYSDILRACNLTCSESLEIEFRCRNKSADKKIGRKAEATVFCLWESWWIHVKRIVHLGFDYAHCFWNMHHCEHIQFAMLNACFIEVQWNSDTSVMHLIFLLLLALFVDITSLCVCCPVRPKKNCENTQNWFFHLWLKSYLTPIRCISEVDDATGLLISNFRLDL